MWGKFAGLLACLVVTALPAAGLPDTRLPAGPGTGLEPPEQVGDSDTVTLPNLVPLPPYDVFVGESDQPQGPVWSGADFIVPPGRVPPALRFTTTIQNRGRYGLELAGTPWLPDSEQSDITTSQAYQCVRFSGPAYHAAQRECVRYDRVGTLTWHAQHHHFHIDGFGRYELRREAGGRADMSKAGLVGTSNKVGWCVSDMYNWREDPSAGPIAPVEGSTTHAYERHWYTECTDPLLYSGASWRQGISPGWADTYPAYYAGQEIPLKGVADGIYWIVTTINPKDNPFGLKVAETTWADNVSASRIQIYAGGKKAKLLSPMPAKPYSDWAHNPHDQPGQ